RSGRLQVCRRRKTAATGRDNCLCGWISKADFWRGLFFGVVPQTGPCPGRQGVLVESREFRKRGAPAGNRRLFVKRDRIPAAEQQVSGVDHILLGTPGKYGPPGGV